MSQKKKKKEKDRTTPPPNPRNFYLLRNDGCKEASRRRNSSPVLRPWRPPGSCVTSQSRMWQRRWPRAGCASGPLSAVCLSPQLPLVQWFSTRTVSPEVDCSVGGENWVRSWGRRSGTIEVTGRGQAPHRTGEEATLTGVTCLLILLEPTLPWVRLVFSSSLPPRWSRC